jgi:hypothetical protein
MGALSVLNLASNNLGECVLAAGWRSKDDDDMAPWVGPEGQEQDEKPGKPEGIIAIANAIPEMGALTKLTFGDKQVVTMTIEITEANFSGKLKSHEAQIVAAFLPKCT